MTVSNDPTQLQLSMQCRVFHLSDCLSNPQPLLELLDSVGKTFPGISFDADITANRFENKFRVRKLKPTAENWAKIRSELQAGAISTLVFGTREPSGYDIPISVWVHTFNELDRRRHISSSEIYDEFGFRIKHTLLEEHIVDVSKCVSLLKQAWNSLHGVYGMADMCVTHRTGLISPGRIDEVAKQLRAKVHCLQPGQPKVDLRVQVQDAYWLNLLNSHHLQAIGGINRVKAHLSGVQIESLPFSGILNSTLRFASLQRYGKLANRS